MINPKIERLIDANLNRLREALRLLEDISRYIFDSKELSKSFKELRHKLTPLFDTSRLEYRDITTDVGKESIDSEMQRGSLKDLVDANFSRAKESSRVLEEAFKLTQPQASAILKEIRYKIYELEKIFYKEYM
ncbi:MAG: thiamine-phosphate pyrophosphorylase [Epsilonproteobacteria bacterium]|nr:thiamine-phosphate pyrophosphorylase [Campylobacterota bacterium]